MNEKRAVVDHCCVCVCVSMYVCVHVYIYIHIYIYMYYTRSVCILHCVCVCIYIYMATEPPFYRKYRANPAFPEGPDFVSLNDCQNQTDICLYIYIYICIICGVKQHQQRCTCLLSVCLWHN